ncbi:MULTISPECIES: TonB-dependent receptor plug domain-containing protein [Sphingobium]|jgi:vitamin B12 transporter|uniref:TonB-dependent receptor plug domain-containing protein n=1 Tax=Sphingobium TaxID=165695 RepID=UPI001D187FD5|nr:MULTISPECIES: TonB-dependent receptor [Sphingobium]MCC4257910.1 TonB-dependent receptor [Sphingobium lactosutens]|tara:strand:- start:1026 stop:2969 length:1944 start_codon:yes stop_codon:yes gene_type:complete
MQSLLLKNSVAFVALSIAFPALAQAPEEMFDDSGIVVTATRTPTPLDQVPASITVLDKAAIDRAQDIGATELLLRTPGISMSRNGGYGTATSLRIRGAESEQTVVVIDGVKLNDPSSTGGGYNFANLLIGDAQRIEVLRGPQSTLWGSQAIGGVVNIVTASPQAPIEGSFDIEAGSRDTVSARAALGGVSGPLSWRIGGQSFTTEGISAIAPAFGGGERDGYTNRNVAGRAELALGANASIDLRGYYSTGRVEIDGFSGDAPDYSHNREFVGYAGLNFALLDGRLRNRIAYNYTDTDRDSYSPELEQPLSFEAAGKNRRFEYQGIFDLSDRISATFGVENERSRFKSRSPSGSLADPLPDFVRGKAEITSVYGQLTVRPLDGLTINGGVRHDDHNRYGGRTLFSAGGIWTLPSGTTLRASYGEGFKAPSLYQLFSEYGNVNLDPERAHGWEAGAQQAFFGDMLTIGATYFERTTTGQIIYNGCDVGTTDPLCVVPGTDTPRWGYYLNVARAEAHGVEADAAFRLGGLTLDGNYSWTVAEDRSAGTANEGNWLPRRPRHLANASLSYDFAFGLTLGSAVRWAGKSYDNASNATRLDDYTLVDLRAEYRLSDSLRLFARAENVFDEQYMTAYRYGTLGRSIYAGIRGRF